MRMRRKKHGAERIAACSELLITEYERLKDEPQFSFPKEAPLRLEIGCGKGDFALPASLSKKPSLARKIAPTT